MKGMKITLLSLFFLVIVFSQVLGTVSNNLHVTLKLDSTQVNQQSQQSLQASITFENNGEQVISLPEIAMPRDDNIKSSMFDVISTTSGKRAVYKGVSSIYNPNAQVHISPSQSISSSFNLLNFYHFEEDGEYEVKLNSKVIGKQEKGTIQLTSNSVFIQVSGSSPFISRSENKKRYASYTFSGCNPQQQSDLDIYVSDQYNIVSYLIPYYLDVPCTNNGYDEFFSTDHTYYSDVSETFDNLFNLIDTGSFVFVCDNSFCGSTEIAFVDNTDTSTHTINICPGFWSLTDNYYTFDSKSGALTMAMVQFDDIACASCSMYPYASDEPDCAYLAAYGDPYECKNNPSSYQYFQEVVPFCGEFNLLDCYDISDPTSYYVDDCSYWCTDSIFYTPPFFCDPAIIREPDYDVESVTTTGTDPNYWTLIDNIHANRFINITGVQPGSTYYFATCRLSDNGDYYNSDDLLPFPTGLIVRDPDGNMLAYNFGCRSCDAPDLNGALLEYTHSSSATFNNIHVELIVNPYPLTTTTPASCNRESNEAVPIYQRVEFAVTCDAYLLPKSDVTITLTTTTAPITAGDVSNADDPSFCDNAETFTVSPLSVTCDDVGTYVDITVTQTTGGSQSVVTPVFVTDGSDPVITCSTEQWIDGRDIFAGEFCMANDFETDLICYIQITQLNLGSYIAVTDNCGVVRNTGVKEVVKTDPNNVVTVGIDLKVDYSISDTYGNTDLESCTISLYGLYLTNVTTETIFKLYPTYEFYFDFFIDIASPALGTEKVYLFLSQIGNGGSVYDKTLNKFHPITLSNLDAYSLASTTDLVTSVFAAVDFRGIKSNNPFRLTLALVGSAGPSILLSYGNPVIYIIS